MTQLQITAFCDPSVLRLNPSLDKVPAEGEGGAHLLCGVNPSMPRPGPVSAGRRPEQGQPALDAGL